MILQINEGNTVRELSFRYFHALHTPRPVGFLPEDKRSAIYQSSSILDSVYQRAGLESICKIRIINEKRSPTVNSAGLRDFITQYVLFRTDQLLLVKERVCPKLYQSSVSHSLLSNNNILIPSSDIL